MVGADALTTHATHPHLQAPAPAPSPAQQADSKSEANGHHAVALVPRAAPRDPNVLAHHLQRAHPVQASYTAVKEAAPSPSAAPVPTSSSHSPLSSLHHAQSDSPHPLAPLAPLAPLSLGRPPSLLPFPSSSSLSAGLGPAGNDDARPPSPPHPSTDSAVPQEDPQDKEDLQNRDIWYLSGPPEAVTQARTALLRDAPQSAQTTLRVPTHLLYPPPLEPGTEAELQALRATIQERIDAISQATGTTIRISNPVARDAGVAAISQAESETFAELTITGSHDTVALAQIRLLVLSDQLVRYRLPPCSFFVWFGKGLEGADFFEF